MVNVIRWVARVLSILYVLFHAMSFMGDRFTAALTASDYIKLALWGLVMLGMILAWFRERAGSLIILGVFLIQIALNPMLFLNWAMWPVPITGLMFLFCSMISRKKNATSAKST